MAMETHFRLGLFTSKAYYYPFSHSTLPPKSSSFHQNRSVPKKTFHAGIPSSALSGSEVAGEEIVQMFLKERQTDGDFVTKVYDNLWRKYELKFVDPKVNIREEQIRQIDLLKVEVDELEENTEFLKLTKNMDWISSENTAPVNKKLLTKKWKDEGEKRKKVNMLKYEALKGELLLLTVAVGAACCVYCFINLSTEAAISYAIGVLLSCLYLQLLYHHIDKLSKESVPRIFIQKRAKKIGIRSEDLKNMLEKTLSGSSMALSSPRLVIPATIYGLWVICHQYLNNFDFQLAPAMVGFFAYKAAALVQVYRDNENLRIVFPDDEENSEEH
ncbi:uncharacterized protein LOC110026460 [Phalaenopsis equestris]|uniref:uncharacterized protein LOC110026460 n=1 Tax=Phalaenopsis equestris TaxID=78828 RepID=UPI0009E2F7F1|nr:uncharacterized protein LOC110026460 [Phalaenopsis equestris]